MELDKIIESIGWSQGVLIIALFCIFIFKKEIADKIKTIKSVSKDGILMDQNQEIKNTNVKSNNNDDLLGNIDSIVIKQQKEIIKKDLLDRNLSVNTPETTDILIHQLAISQLKLNFEKIYNIIFGTQIHLLKKLNENPKHPDYVESYSQGVIDNHQEMANWDINNYLNFLFENALIIFNKEDNVYAITNYGHEFLLWLLETGNNEDKNY